MIQIALKGVKSKYQHRAIKVITLVLNNSDSEVVSKIFEEFERLRDEGIKLCYTMLKSKNERLWNITFDLWKNVFSKIVKSISSNLLLAFDDIFFEQALTNEKDSIREKSMKSLKITKAKMEKIHQLCFDKDSNVRVALYEKLRNEKKLLKLPEGKLYRFLTRGFNEIDPKAKQAFYELLTSFIILPVSEEASEESKADDMS